MPLFSSSPTPFLLSLLSLSPKKHPDNGETLSWSKGARGILRRPPSNNFHAVSQCEVPKSGRAYVTGKTSARSWKLGIGSVHKDGFIFFLVKIMDAEEVTLEASDFQELFILCPLSPHY